MKNSNDLTKFARTILVDAEFSISRQIYFMLYDDAIFRLFRQLKTEAEQLSLETALSNPFIARLANVGYINNTTLSIMRLCDTRKDVVSFPMLLTNLKRFSSRGLIEKAEVEGWQKDYGAIPIEDLKNYRDKYLAHQDHQVTTTPSLDVSIIDECEKRIVALANSIIFRLLGENTLFLPTPHLSMWNHRNFPLVPEALNARMYEIWDEREREVGGWVGL